MSTLSEKIPDYAKDIKLNLSSVLKEEGSPGLNQKQILGIALASAYATKNSNVVSSILAESSGFLKDEDHMGAKKAVSIMAMNNIYYRFIHNVDDESITKLPARLRMNVIANPGINKIEFELYCLAVSAINGCGMCMSSHAKELKRSGLSAEGIQSSIRIASVIHAAAVALVIE